MARAIRLTEPTCRLSFAVISRIGAPSRASRINARFSASVHSFGFGLIAKSLFRLRSTVPVCSLHAS